MTMAVIAGSAGTTQLEIEFARSDNSVRLKGITRSEGSMIRTKGSLWQQQIRN